MATDDDSFDRNPVHRGYLREIDDILRVLDGTDNNPNRMPLTPDVRKNLELQLDVLRSRDDDLAMRLSRPDAVKGDPYGRTREEIDAETRRLRG